MRSFVASLLSRIRKESAEVPAWKEEAWKLFDLYDRSSPPEHLPQAFQIESLEKAAKQSDSLKEFLALVPPRAILQNFATSIWEFAKGVDTLTSFPWNVTIPVADLCNARCTFCTSWLEGRKVLDLKKLEVFEPILKRAIFVGLVGHGEPLAHPHFDELCERLQKILDPRAVCYTITNGVFLEKWRDCIDRLNLCSFSISLNAATPETHDEIMGLGRDAFPRILDSIARLVAVPDGRRPPERLAPRNNTYITMVVTKQNIAEIPAFIALGNKLGVTGIWLRSLLPQANLVSGLNYHLLPPYDHPDFTSLRQMAIDAIAASAVPVQADPAMWSAQIFSASLARRILQSSPAVVSREQALRDLDLRQRRTRLYSVPQGIYRGQRVVEDALSARLSPDALDDGTNPFGRVPRFACKAVYYNLYINELYYRMNPCCYLQRVPGHEEIRFDGGIEFMDVWNSPGMIALRRHLRDGPLYGACMRCPEKW